MLFALFVILYSINDVYCLYTAKYVCTYTSWFIQLFALVVVKMEVHAFYQKSVHVLQDGLELTVKLVRCNGAL